MTIWGPLGPGEVTLVHLLISDSGVYTPRHSALRHGYRLRRRLVDHLIDLSLCLGVFTDTESVWPPMGALICMDQV